MINRFFAWAKYLQNTTPVQTKDKDAKSPSEQENTNPVKAKEEILCKRFSVQHAESRRVVKNIPCQHASSVDGNEQVEAVSPASRVFKQAVSNSCRKRTGGRSHCVAERVGNIAPSHRDKFGDDPEEGLLESDSYANKDLSADESVDVLGNSAHDGSDEGNDRAYDEEPVFP